MDQSICQIYQIYQFSNSAELSMDDEMHPAGSSEMHFANTLLRKLDMTIAYLM